MFRHGLALVLASAGLFGLVATFAVELGSFRRSVEAWAMRDLFARTELAAMNLREPLRTGDFRALYAFGASCGQKGLQLTVFSPNGGLFYDSCGKPRPSVPEDAVYSSAQSGEFVVRLGLPRARVLAPFHRARRSFILAALAGGAGMLFVFFFTYRQHVRIRELARLEKFRRDFVADVSHELKTPLTGILGAVDLLTAMPPESALSQTDRLTALIAREARRLDALAQGILDMARLERTDIAVNRTSTDLCALVSDVVESFRPQAREKGVSLEVTGMSDVVVDCDAQLIGRAVSNLVGNAIRHSGSKTITTSVVQEGGSVRISVEDHGKGIPAEEVERVFERFHRVDPARAAETGGAGLGLAIVRRISRLHGGDAALESVSPSGCRFVIALPVTPNRRKI